MSIYNRSGGGYGITGSRNVFSTRTHIGNWVEDVIGNDLVQPTRRPFTTLYETAAMNDWIEPSLQTVRTGPNTAKFSGSVRYLSKEELKIKNKEGMPYDLLFQHGKNGEDIPPNQRYQAQSTLSFAQTQLPKGEDPPVEVRRQREKAKEIKKELEKSYGRTCSEANFANGFAMNSTTLAPRAVTAGESQNLPNFRRKVLVSNAMMKYR